MPYWFVLLNAVIIAKIILRRFIPSNLFFA